MPPPEDERKSSKSSPGKVKLTSHPLVARLHPEPDSPQDHVALVGYFGPSKKDACMRLYTDLNFRSYYDIPIDGIVHTQPTDAKDENGPTTVLVMASTKLDVIEATHQCVEASYLQGAIAGNYLAGASGVGFRAAPTLQGLQSIYSECCPTEGGGEGGGNGGGGGHDGTNFFSGCIWCRPRPRFTDFCSRRPMICR